MDVREVSPVLHRYTFGIKRAVVNLLCCAWNIAKTKRSNSAMVGFDDLKAAYLSPMYAVFREDVEALWRHSMGDENVREDLKNPFGVDAEEATNVTMATSAIREWKRQVVSAHLQDSLTPAEKAAEKELAATDSSAPPPERKLLPLKRKVSTKENLLDVLEQLR